MSVRWRLAILFLQVLVLSAATYHAEGQPYSASAWFLSGILAVVVNPQLWEPYFSRPADVLGNAILAGLLALTATRTHAALGWNILGGFLFFFGAVAALALLLGAGRTGRMSGVGRFAAMVCRVASGRAIYSGVFLLSLYESMPTLTEAFWFLVLGWVIVLVLGSVNWQGALAAASGRPGPCGVVGLVGPSTLLVEAPVLPSPGTLVKVRSGGLVADAFVANRIAREADVWGQLHLLDAEPSERLLRSRKVSMEPLPDETDVVGAVAEGSTHLTLQFYPVGSLEVGQVVSVPSPSGPILYQLRSAAVERASVKGGAHLVVKTQASHLGVFDAQTLELRSHRWVPEPGSLVRPPLAPDTPAPPNSWLQLGTLSGTKIPLYVDCDQLCEGHGAILGMTRMGKTTLAVKLAQRLAVGASVTVLDQTGEYVGKRGLAAYAGTGDDTKLGLSVLEPAVGAVAANEGLKYFQAIAQLAQGEYLKNAMLKRVVLIDEAHQFVPEPAQMGFNAPGRDSSAQFGQLMMQVRKFGISVLLVSQRTAVVAKSALSQCENVIAFKSVDRTGLDYLEDIAGTEARKLLPALSQGQALVFGPAMSCESPAVVDVSL